MGGPTSSRVYARGLSIAHKKASIRELARPDQVRSVVVDPSAATLKPSSARPGTLFWTRTTRSFRVSRRHAIGSGGTRRQAADDDRPGLRADDRGSRETISGTPTLPKRNAGSGQRPRMRRAAVHLAHLYRPPATVFDSVRIQPSGMAAGASLSQHAIPATWTTSRGRASGSNRRSSPTPTAAVMFSRPLRGREYRAAVVASAGGMPTLLAVGDSLSREVVRIDMEITGQRRTGPQDRRRRVGAMARVVTQPRRRCLCPRPARACGPSAHRSSIPGRGVGADGEKRPMRWYSWLGGLAGVADCRARSPVARRGHVRVAEHPDGSRGGQRPTSRSGEAPGRIGYWFQVLRCCCGCWTARASRRRPTCTRSCRSNGPEHASWMDALAARPCRVPTRFRCRDQGTARRPAFASTHGRAST